MTKCTPQLLMGIDVGTYSSKGVLCTTAGETLAQHQVEHGMSVPRPGWAEHDAGEEQGRELVAAQQHGGLPGSQ